MNEKFNKNAKVEKLTKKVGRGVRLIVIGPYPRLDFIGLRLDVQLNRRKEPLGDNLCFQ